MHIYISFQENAGKILSSLLSDKIGSYVNVSTELLTVDHHDSIKLSVHWCVWKDIKMGSCVFQCDVPHQWIAQRQDGPVSVYCDGVGYRVLCLRHGISVWQHIGQSTTATSRHRRDMTSDVSKRR